MLNNDVVILCGGLGKRLKSVTQDTPKVLAALGDEPFLTVILNHIYKAQFKRVILCTGYKADDVQEHYGNAYKDVELVYSKEEEPLGTGGAIKHAKGLVKEAPFFVLNGDSYCPIDFAAMLDFHQSHGAKATVALSQVADSKDYGLVEKGESEEILKFKEKQEEASGLANAGVYCFDGSVFDRMPEGAFSLESDCFPKWIGQSFYGYETKETFWDIGTPERYKLAQDNLNDS